MKNVAIIGAGLQGKRRVPPILADKNYKITWVIDRNIDRAMNLASLCQAKYGTDWKEATADKNVDVILVLTYNDSHAGITIDALNNNKHVLCEKPLARTEKEAKEMVALAKKQKRILKCGFNHRHHPAILEAYKFFRDNHMGKILFGRGLYGIAGREGIEKEWRSNPEIVSGGQLMEQGIHLVDLFRWFLGEIHSVTGMVNTNYWPIKPLEDNGFAILQTQKGVMATIHSSLTQWINLFEFEIYGEKAYFKVQGLGGAYGNQKLIYGIKEPDKPFSYQTIEYRGGDTSWAKEWQEFTDAIDSKKEPIGNGLDGLKAMQIVNAVYESSKTGKKIELKV
jgi:predicted dehydrogenase